MYVPRHFEITDDQEIFAFIRAYAFGQLVSIVDAKPVASHIPFLLTDDRSVLLGHLARQNPQWKTIDDQTVLVTLVGPHDYISPSWYSSINVPTWNYQSVHVYGRCTTFTKPARLKQLVDGLTRHYESAFDEPWQPDYPDPQLGAIVGLELAISEIQCAYKLSQNRSQPDRAEVIKQLAARGSQALAQAMSRNEKSKNRPAPR